MVADDGMNQVQLNIICSFFDLGHVLNGYQLIIPKRLWYLKTTQGEFAVKKLTAKNLYQNPLQGERIAIGMSRFKLPVVHAISGKNGIILELGEDKIIVYPWVQGSCIKVFSLAQCYKVGELLGVIHKINLQLPNVNSAIWHDRFIAPDWQTVSKEFPFLIKRLPDLINWNAQYLTGISKLSSERVISHGDLTQTNIIWQTPKKLCLIDWEAAGWLHPQIELLGLALNCSDFVLDKFSTKKFLAVLKGYFAVTHKIVLEQCVLQAGLGSWLNWLVFNLYRTSDNNKNVSLEVINTAKMIGRLIDLFPQIMTIQKN